MGAVRELELPYPPSVNHYYRHVGPRVLISRDGRRYRELIVAKLKAEMAETFVGPVDLHIELYPPDNRRRDVDNCLKCLLDAFTHGGLYEDDSLIRRLTVIKQEPMPSSGMAYVRIQPWNNDRTAVTADTSSSSSC